MILARFQTRSVRRGRVLLTFFVGGLSSGLLFTFLVSRPSLQALWFHREEFWVIPTWKLSLLTGSMFLVGLAGSYALSHWQGWISYPAFRSLLGLILLVAAAIAAWLVLQSFPLAQFFLLRIILVLFLSLALFWVTRRWLIWISVLMLMVCVSAPFVASIPDTFVRPFPNEWFEALKFVITSSLISLLSSYWLVLTDEPPRTMA